MIAIVNIVAVKPNQILILNKHKSQQQKQTCKIQIEENDRLLDILDFIYTHLQTQSALFM